MHTDERSHTNIPQNSSWHLQIQILGDIWIQRQNMLRLKFGGDLHKTTQNFHPGDILCNFGAENLWLKFANNQNLEQ